MVDCQSFFNNLAENKISFFAGVPDSLLKDICAYITVHATANHHFITPNEGNAIALATGYHLATDNIPMVYMQNSGLGNCINPLTSLTDPEIYAIPMLLMIGWRGSPGFQDEPQHIKMGRISQGILEKLEIPYELLPQDTDNAIIILQQLIQKAKKNSSPVALLVKNNTFTTYNLQMDNSGFQNQLSREAAIRIVLDSLPEDSIVVSTTGKISREVYEYQSTHHLEYIKNFLVVGSMGHASHIALGLALHQPGKSVFCFDGDGAALMHLGSFATAGIHGTENFYHIVFNNAAHDSVGGQPTMADQISLTGVAMACGYKKVYRSDNLVKLKSFLPKILSHSGPSMLEILVEKGSRVDLMRPKTTPLQNKMSLMEAL